ncbi:MAG TPA: SIS domain-containing protein [Capsulimonadaceae bacterium]|jgi:glucose/mannose-6-phosphate isomerase
MLDNVNLIARQDTSGAMPLLMAYAEQALVALNADLPEFVKPEPLANVVVVGFGTSGAAADAIVAYLRDKATVPVAVVKDRRVPSYVGPQSLVIVASYSGDTGDCADAYTDAIERGATVVAVTRGGAVEELASERAVVRLPAGYGAQFSLPATFFTLYRVLAEHGVFERQPEDEAEALQLLARQCRALAPDVPEVSNPAKQMASALLGKLPVIYAGSDWLHCVAQRWCSQINASGKLLAHPNTYPELTHNELLAWQNATKQCQQLAVVLLRDRGDDSVGAARVGAAADLIPTEVDVHEVYAEGITRLARLWTALTFADISSAYLALAWGGDPSAV